MVSSYNFPMCCGIHVIAGFGLDDEGRGHILTDVDKISIKTDLVRKIKTDSGVGLQIVALNSLQISAGIGEVVESVGFIKIGPYFYHPGHGRNIQLYVFEQYPDRCIKIKETKKPKTTKSKSRSKSPPVRRASVTKKRIFVTDDTD